MNRMQMYRVLQKSIARMCSFNKQHRIIAFGDEDLYFIGPFLSTPYYRYGK